MNEARSTAPPRDKAAETVSRRRNCLRCDASFQSEWSGERICHRCKNTAAWRARNTNPEQATFC